MKKSSKWVPKTEEGKKFKEVTEWVVENPDSENWDGPDSTLPISPKGSFGFRATRENASVSIDYHTFFLSKDYFARLTLGNHYFSFSYQYRFPERRNKPFEQWLFRLGTIVAERTIGKSREKGDSLLNSAYQKALKARQVSLDAVCKKVLDTTEMSLEEMNKILISEGLETISKDIDRQNVLPQENV